MNITPITSAPSIIRGLESCPIGTVLEHPLAPSLAITKVSKKGRVWEDANGNRATTYGAFDAGYIASDFGAETAAA